MMRIILILLLFSFSCFAEKPIVVFQHYEDCPFTCKSKRPGYATEMAQVIFSELKNDYIFYHKISSLKEYKDLIKKNKIFI